MDVKTRGEFVNGFEVRLGDSSADGGKAFNELFLSAVDCSLSALGCAGKEVLYSQLDQKFGLPKQSLPQNVKVLSHALDAIFGQGSVLLQMKIMQELYKKAPDFRYHPKQELSFVGYIEEFKRFYTQ
ncbi:MAG: hypothetical protein NWF04_02680 [Candidatus Bathyarchaeota archaeon]|nr:hypothetical protein [Candidatus Bathyarchaeota archaeon]